MVLDHAWLTRETISTFLGYSSIVAWLGAQVPQLVENYKNGSVEGLALPFLVSWLFGDLTNLIGCILTHQLPFQTYLATYFVTVDVGLMSQYVYYSRKNPPPSLPPLSTSYPHVHGHTPRHSYIRTSRSENWGSMSRTKSHKRRSKSGEYAGRTKNSSAGTEDPMERSWMSQSSAATHSPASTRPRTVPSRSRQHSVPESLSSPHELPSPVIGGSEHRERGRTLTRPPVPRPPSRQIFGNTLETISGSPASGSPVPDHRYSLGFGIPSEGPHQEHHHSHHRNSSHSLSRSRPPTSRRGTGIALLSIGLLATFGRWSNGVGMAESGGLAWSAGPEQPSAVATNSRWPPLEHPVFFSFPIPSKPISQHSRRYAYPSAVAFETATDPTEPTPPKHDPPPEDDDDPYPPYRGRDWERFIGRASAWICTTLYLTSRLPQIWQNFRRRSVEGLSILLFVMAFVGNTLYFLSILTHPSLSTPGYLLESTPYLLGSGGTLCFDITIVLQSIVYSDSRKARLERDKRRSARYGLDAEEAAALLSRDEETGTTETGTEEEEDESSTAGYRSRSRSHGRRSRSSRRPASRQRSDSTELAKKYVSSQSGPMSLSTSTSDLDPFRDRPFDFDQRSRSAGSGSGGESLRRSRTLSAATSDGSIIGETIAEEGESSVTIRP